MANHTLTEERIAKARDEGKRYLWEVSKHGEGSLGVYFGKSRMAYVYKYAVAGDGEEQVTIGSDADLTLRTAREKVIEIKANLRKGIKPISYKQERIAKQKADLAAKTVKQCFEEYSYDRDTKSRYWREVLRLYNIDVLPAIGNRKIGTVTPSDIHAILRKRKNTPANARYIYDFLNPFFTWCLAPEQNYITASPMNSVTKPKKAELRDRILSEAEIVAFWHSCDELGYPFGSLFKLLLLTAQRREECAGLRWQEIDRNKQEWLIPKARSKNKKAHLVHLSPQAMEVLESLPRLNSEFAFTTTLDASVSGYSKVKIRLDKLMEAKLGYKLEYNADTKEDKSWRLHDLRRTAASTMAMLSFAPHVVDKVLNHVKKDLIARYQRYEYIKERNEAIMALGRYVDNLVNSTASNVIEFKRSSV